MTCITIPPHKTNLSSLDRPSLPFPFSLRRSRLGINCVHAGFNSIDPQSLYHVILEPFDSAIPFRPRTSRGFAILTLSAIRDPRASGLRCHADSAHPFRYHRKPERTTMSNPGLSNGHTRAPHKVSHLFFDSCYQWSPHDRRNTVFLEIALSLPTRRST